MSENTATALQERALAVLAPFVELRVNDDLSLGFEYAGALCSIRAVNLSPGLDVLSLTCVLAWDRPLKPALLKRVADRNDALQFGSITVIGNGKLADVMMRYTFPAAGLDDEALTTMLLLVLSGADRSRQGLLP
ncbi:YbjN domain-containing protein [Antrihabitans sp. YC2-6]|uniref:YbjN domain-containing protein n=1 Tax=Antrihabitans sp. YC2-6 TaxID=2799498 RepID=UPI0018F66399|nr:YbjN domain-containing protein [Antrihabitans sp. YC2-6]MBJ8346869.1 YbjN domain-containing protein [Antrihabitans sp. YC2-6]